MPVARLFRRVLSEGLVSLAFLAVLGFGALVAALWLERRSETTLPAPTGPFMRRRPPAKPGSTPRQSMCWRPESRKPVVSSSCGSGFPRPRRRPSRTTTCCGPLSRRARTQRRRAAPKPLRPADARSVEGARPRCERRRRGARAAVSSGAPARRGIGARHELHDARRGSGEPRLRRRGTRRSVSHVARRLPRRPRRREDPENDVESAPSDAARVRLANRLFRHGRRHGVRRSTGSSG